MGARLFPQRARRGPGALEAERRRSPAPGSARIALLEGGRTWSGKEGKLRASLCSLHHFQSKLRHEEGRVGARRVQTPGGRPPGQKRLPRGPVGVLGAAGVRSVAAQTG